MTTTLVVVTALAAAGGVLAAATASAPPPARVLRLTALHRQPGVDRGAVRIGGLGAAAGRLAEILGRWLRRTAGRPPSAMADRRAGWSALGCAVLLPVSIPLAVFGAFLPPAFGAVAERRHQRGREAAVRSALPEAVDLLRLGVEAGLTPGLALAEAAPRLGGPVGAVLTAVVAEVGVGRPLGNALADLPTRLGEPVRPLVAALTAAAVDGAPLGPTLERLSREVRDDRRRRAEEAARRLPVKLLFPLVCCALPAFALLTIVPLVAGALSSLRL